MICKLLIGSEVKCGMVRKCCNTLCVGGRALIVTCKFSSLFVGFLNQCSRPFYMSLTRIMYCKKVVGTFFPTTALPFSQFARKACLVSAGLSLGSHSAAPFSRCTTCVWSGNMRVGQKLERTGVAGRAARGPHADARKRYIAYFPSTHRRMHLCIVCMRCTLLQLTHAVKICAT